MKDDISCGPGDVYVPTTLQLGPWDVTTGVSTSIYISASWLPLARISSDLLGAFIIPRLSAFGALMNKRLVKQGSPSPKSGDGRWEMEDGRGRSWLRSEVNFTGRGSIIRKICISKCVFVTNYPS